MILRQASKADLPAILALQNGLAPERRRMPISDLEEALFSLQHAHGKHTALAFEGPKLRAVAGWVRGPGGEFFGSPVFCADEASGALVLSHLLGEAAGSRWIRVSCFPEEAPKRAVLIGNDFLPEFEFVEFETVPRDLAMPELPYGIKEFPLREAGPAEFRELMNSSFAGVDNSLPISEAEAEEILSGQGKDPALCLGWRDASGQLVAFVLTDSSGYLDSIGIAPACQKLGYGGLLYRRVLALAARGGHKRIFTTVSSRNEGSLRLHQRLGIPEVERRTVYQRNL